jgi:hypothetical protein
VAAPPQWAPQPPQPQYAPPPPAAPATTTWPPPEQPRTGPPTWLVTVGVMLAFLGILGGIYYFLQHSSKPAAAEKTGLESPAAPSQQKVTNPMQKYVEVVGIRMISENKKPVVKFLVVNHSSAEIPDLAANVTLWASTSRSDEDQVGTFSFKLKDLPANESKELSEPLTTKRKMYELPDWQNATPEIEITSPAQ